MSDLIAEAAGRVLRVAIAQQYALRNCDRSLTPAERQWVREGWIPASLRMEGDDE